MEHFLNIRLQCAELTREELDFVLLGQIMATLSDGPHTTAEKHRHTATECKLTSMAFYHAGQRICGRTFQWLHGIGTLTSYINILLVATIQPPSFFISGKDRFMAVIASYIASGLTTRQHRNSHTLRHNAISFADIQHALSFLHNYAEAHAILLPGRIPGYKRDDLQLLPSSTTKKVITSYYCCKYMQRGLLNYYFSAGCLGRVQVGL